MATTVKELPIDKIELDYNNPRIAQFIEQYGAEIPSSQVALALGSGDNLEKPGSTSFQSLRKSIKTNGGIINPIIVNHVNNRYLVIEGNTRVAIYREFFNNNIDGDWDKIMAIVHQNMTSEEIDSVRLQAHLVGPRDWFPYAKAKYLKYLSESKHLTINQIIDYCGGRETEINNYIQAYEDMESYYRPLVTDDEFDHTRFSAFVELQKSSMKTAIVNANFNYTDFSRWIHEQKIYPLLSIRNLPAVLNNREARDVFIRHNGRRAIQEAEKVLSIPDTDAQLKEASLKKLADELIRRILHYTYEEFSEMLGDNPNDTKESVLRARDKLIEFCDDILNNRD